MGTPATAALAFLAPVAAICIWVAWSDLSRMKIPNLAVLALLLTFALIGPFVLPLGEWGWRWVHFALFLLIGIGLNAAGIMGAGDAKFIAAAAPFVAASDAVAAVVILAVCAVSGYLLHRVAKRTALARAVPHWESWSSGNRFPFGFPLAVSLVLYLALVAFQMS